MPAVSGFEKRITALIAAAPSQAELARVSKVTEGTVINWSRGLGYHESTLRKFAENTGVSIAWLRDGKGDQAFELERLKRRFGAAQDEPSPRIREDEADMIRDNIKWIIDHGSDEDRRMLEDLVIATRRRIYDRKRG